MPREARRLLELEAKIARDREVFLETRDQRDQAEDQLKKLVEEFELELDARAAESVSPEEKDQAVPLEEALGEFLTTAEVRYPTYEFSYARQYVTQRDLNDLVTPEPEPREGWEIEHFTIGASLVLNGRIVETWHTTYRRPKS